MASYPATKRRPPASESSSGAFWMVATMLLGFTVAIVGFFALMMWADARESRDTAAQPAATSEATPAPDGNVALPLASFAGVVPENAAVSLPRRTSPTTRRCRRSRPATSSRCR